MDESISSLFEEVSHGYNERMNECRALLAKESVQLAQFLREDVETLLEFTEVTWAKFQEEFQPTMSDDSSLSGIMVIDKWQESRFSPHALLHHLSTIKENVKRVEWYMDDAKAEGLGVYLGDDIEHCADSLQDVIVSFTFNTAAFKSKDLKDAFDCLCRRDFDSASSLASGEQDEKINGLVSILIVFDSFVLYSKENSKEPNKKFAITNGSECHDGSLAYTSIFTVDGEKYFELPGKPNRPVYVDNSKTSHSLKVSLSSTDMGEENVTGYKLMVYEVGVLIRSVHLPKTNSGSLEFLVEDLQQGMEYSFKVQSVSQAGCSPKSIMSEKILLDAAVPAGQFHQEEEEEEEEEEGFVSDSDSELSPDEIDTDGHQLVSFARTPGENVILR